MSRSARSDYKKRRSGFLHTEEKNEIRTSICRFGKNLPVVTGIFTFPGETKLDVLNFHKHFPKSKIFGVENDPMVARYCHYEDYGVDFTLYKKEFHSYVDKFAFPCEINIAWLDYQEMTEQRLFDNAKLFSDLYMPNESILIVTFIDQNDMEDNKQKILTTVIHRNPIILEEKWYNATKKTPMQSFIIKLNQLPKI